MDKLQVLVVDDSVVVRRVLTDALSEDPAIEVTGSAANGSICMGKLKQSLPDLVLLDLEMPVMDGLQTLREIRRSYPTLPVIVFSALTYQGAEATLEALACGATDYLPKPSSVADVHEARQYLQQQLIPKIKAICGQFEKRPRRRAPDVAGVRELSIDAVLIGTSTGGPRALEEVLTALPGTFPVPILIVQHMPPIFTKLLADRLSTLVALPVVEASDGDVVDRPGVWFAPGDYHMEARRQGHLIKLRTTQAVHENSCRPSVDVLFRTAAEAYEGRLLAVVLTGMGQDGLRGSECVRARGGTVIVQDEATSVVWGMPGYVAAEGLADRVIPLPQMGPEILRRVMAQPRSVNPRTSASKL